MPRTRLLPSSDLRTNAFYGGANVRQMLFDPSGAPMTQARADMATQREVAETFAEVAGGSTLNMQIVYHYTPLDLWISGKFIGGASAASNVFYFVEYDCKYSISNGVITVSY